MPEGAVYDGDFYGIYNLTYIGGIYTGNCGLFQTALDAEIKNVVLINTDIRIYHSNITVVTVAPLCANVNGDCKITNCHAYGNISIEGNTISAVGGLLGLCSPYEGSVKGPTITRCHSEVNITSTTPATEDWNPGDVGGLVAFLELGVIRDCYSTGNIDTMNHFVGGLVGYLQLSEVRNCYASGNIKGSNYIGGLIGYIWTIPPHSDDEEVPESERMSWIYNSFSLNNAITLVDDGRSLEFARSVGNFLGRDILNWCFHWDDTENHQYIIAEISGSSALSSTKISVHTSDEYNIFTNAAGTVNRSQAMSMSNYPWDFGNIWSIEEGESYPYIEVNLKREDFQLQSIPFPPKYRKMS